MKRFEYKVPDGKLICAKIEVVNNKITNLQISGDFFLLPETDLEDLESQIIGMKPDIEAIMIKVTGFFTERNTTIVGASPEDFAHVIIMAISS